MFKKILRQQWVTLVELIIVLAIVGILITAFTVSYTTYQARSRDSTRIMNIGRLIIGHGVYYNDHDSYPDSVWWCVNSGALIKAIDVFPMDPLFNRDNGCGKNSNYAYGIGSGVLNGGSWILLMTFMENIYWGNYGGSLMGMTGNMLTQAAYDIGSDGISKGQGQYYIQTR